MKQNENLEELLKRLVQLESGSLRPANEVILDDCDVRELLKVSRRTLLDYRKSGKLLYYKIENKIYYFLSDVFQFVKKHTVNYES
jgi:hypothetical protein